ncbi:MAG TPA: helix-turn-helix domain-containing protein [Ktedonobacterales bacterium]
MREPKVFGALLRRYRTTAQLTQKQLAEHTGLSADAIAAQELGARRPVPAATVALLVDALALSQNDRAALQAAADSISPSADGHVPSDTSEARRAYQTQRQHVPWMPLQPTPLIGRAQEIEAVLRMMTVDSMRLLTLVGPAGVGKTRLALAAAANVQLRDHFSDGVILVDLAPVRVPQEVPWAIGRACGFSDTSQRPVGEQLLAYLEDRATGRCCV